MLFWVKFSSIQKFKRLTRLFHELKYFDKSWQISSWGVIFYLLFTEINFKHHRKSGGKSRGIPSMQVLYPGVYVLVPVLCDGIVFYDVWCDFFQMGLSLRGYCTSGPYFWRLCVFSQKISNFGQSILWIWSELFQGTQKSQFYFSRDHCCEVTVKNVRKSIFSMFWAINQ